MGKAKLNIPMCAALVLLLLTMISVHMASGLYARYVTTATGSASARVAKFGIDGTVSGNAVLDCTSETPGEYTVTVINESEVAITYSIDVMFKQSLDPARVRVTLDGETGTWINTNTLSFQSVGELAPSASSDPGHTLMFEVLDWTYITSGVTNEETVEKELDFTVRIKAEQVD